MKRCKRCKKYKNIDNFSKDIYMKDGLKTKCKSCRIQEQEKYRINNPDKIKLLNKNYREAHKDKINKYLKNYRKNNKKYLCKQMKQWRLTHPNANKIWKNNNKSHALEIKRKSNRKRRALILLIKEKYTIKDEQTTLKVFNNQCFNCGAKNNLHIDHHRPLSKNNPLTLYNAVVLCNICNSSKGNKPPEKFYGKKRCAKLDRKLKKIVQLYSK